MISAISALSTARRSSTWLFFLWLMVAGVLSIWLCSHPVAAFVAGLIWLFLAGLVFTHWFNRAVFCLFFAELILGGRGRIISIDDILPLRLGVGIFLVLAFALGWFADGKATKFELRKSRACILAALMGTSTFLFFGLLLGHVYNNSVEYITAEARGFIFLAGAAPLLFFVSRRKVDLSFVVGCFLWITCIFGAAKSFGYILVLTQRMSVKDLSTLVEEAIPQETISGSMSPLIPLPRFYMAGDVFLMFALPIFVSLALATKTRRTRLALYGAIGIAFVSLVASQSRGLWVATLLGLAVVFWLSNVGGKVKLLLIVPLILTGIFAFSKDFLPSVEQRFTMTFDFTEDTSNRGRIMQFQPLMDMARKHIILGNGYGSYAHDHPGPDPKQPWGYELQPVALLMKMGIVGCALWVLFLLWLLYRLWRIYRRAEDPAHRVIAKGIIGGMLGLLFACSTNPTFATSVGMGCLLFTVLVIDLVGERLGAPVPAAAGTSRARILGEEPSTQYRSANGGNDRQSSLVKGTEDRTRSYCKT
jgi:hypothetical protein